MIRWDWYRATVRGVGVDEMINYFISLNDLSSARPATPKNGYLRAVEVVRGDSVLASFWWGGNAGVLVTGTGDRSPGVADFLLRGRMMGWDVSPSRVDACCDWIEPGLFDSLSHQLIMRLIEVCLSISKAIGRGVLLAHCILVLRRLMSDWCYTKKAMKAAGINRGCVLKFE